MKFGIKISMSADVSLISILIRKHLKPVLFRNTVTLVNLLFFIVTLLLFIFKEVRDALFLATVVVLNIVIGVIQELRAKIALEKLQILFAPRITRVDVNGNETSISLEEIYPNDKLKIKLGDQISADGELVESHGLEINEALLTGESDNRTKLVGEKVLAGSIVTAGSGLLRVTAIPHESYVARMTEKIKKYTLNLSPIQKTLNFFIKCMTYVLLLVVAYVLVHGLTLHELFVSIVKDIAALTGTLVPQGLILATTVFFAYGALRMFKKQVLLQEINATEKLGRIKNLCIDKTGTLTENSSLLEGVITYDNVQKSFIAVLVNGYVVATEDSSETMKAITEKLISREDSTPRGSLPFSSQRKYGAAALEIKNEMVTVVIGAPDILLPFIASTKEQQWLQNLIDNYAKEAKRLVCVTQSIKPIPPSTLTYEPTKASLSPLAMLVLSNPLRPGTREIVDFFQKRNVHIRVISGDNPDTVQAIAREAGIKNIDLVITGPEIKQWDKEAFEERVPAYHVFARITPDQKEKIVSLLKRTAFTAMVGDGANDAFALKKADLGIAMFNGASATRQIAQIILMNNSFAALPVGVTMAETIITNIELVAGIFFNKVVVGLFLFIGLAFLGFTYPISPRNITIINYCVVFLPLLYWALFPAHKQGSTTAQSFLRKVLPFSVLSGALTAVAAIIVFILSPTASQVGGSNIYVVLVLIALGYWFFVLAPQAYGIVTKKLQKKILYLFAVIILFLLFLVMRNQPLSRFFDLQWPEFVSAGLTIAVIGCFGWIQYQVMLRWFNHGHNTTGQLNK